MVFSVSCLNASEGVVVILNGPSSCGKSSIQKAFQKKANQQYLAAGIDNFFDALIQEPDLSSFETDKKFDQYTPSGEYIRGIELTKDDIENPVVLLKIGPAGDRIIFGMHRAIAAYAQTGNNLIVDYILYSPSWAKDLAKSLINTKVYLVKVDAPLEVIEQREIKRNTSPRGHARSHYNTVHQGMNYDLEIDSSKSTPEESAQIIIDFIKANTDPKGLRSMTRSY